MANEIKALFGNSGVSTAFTVTLVSLASSTAGVGRQTPMIVNTTTRFQTIHIFAKITTGTSPTVDKSIDMYFLKGNNNNYNTDGAGASDAALTIVGADLLNSALTDATSDKAYYLEAVIHNPGLTFGIAIVHDTAVNLNSTAANQFIEYLGSNPEVQ